MPEAMDESLCTYFPKGYPSAAVAVPVMQFCAGAESTDVWLK